MKRQGKEITKKYVKETKVQREYNGEFIVGNELKTGVIWVVDKFGTFDYKDDVSYDIMIESENCLYKHIPEKQVVQRCYKMKLKSWTENGENILK